MNTWFELGSPDELRCMFANCGDPKTEYRVCLQGACLVVPETNERDVPATLVAADGHCMAELDVAMAAAERMAVRELLKDRGWKNLSIRPFKFATGKDRLMPVILDLTNPELVVIRQGATVIRPDFSLSKEQFPEHWRDISAWGPRWQLRTAANVMPTIGVNPNYLARFTNPKSYMGIKMELPAESGSSEAYRVIPLTPGLRKVRGTVMPIRL